MLQYPIYEGTPDGDRVDGVISHPIDIQHPMWVALAARVILDRYESTEEAVDFLEEIPHARNTNFLIADATGTIAIVEASPHQVRSHFPKEGYGAITNHFLSTEMKEFEGSPDPSSTSNVRHDNLASWFAKSNGNMDIEQIQQVCKDTENGVCSSSHEDAKDPIETLWSLTAALELPDIYLAKGRPDKVEFEQSTL